MSNQGLLAVIAVLLMGIFTVLLLETTEKTPTDQMADNLARTEEKIAHTIDGATDRRGN